MCRIMQSLELQYLDNVTLAHYSNITHMKHCLFIVLWYSGKETITPDTSMSHLKTYAT